MCVSSSVFLRVVLLPFSCEVDAVIRVKIGRGVKEWVSLEGIIIIRAFSTIAVDFAQAHPLCIHEKNR